MIIKIRVKPDSNKEGIEKNDEGYKVHVKAKAEKGKANLALIKLIAKYFNVSSSQVRIKRGITSHDKIIEILEGKQRKVIRNLCCL